MGKHGKALQKAWECMEKFEKVPEHWGFYGKAWKSMGKHCKKHGNVWKSSKRYKNSGFQWKKLPIIIK